MDQFNKLGTKTVENTKTQSRQAKIGSLGPPSGIRCSYVRLELNKLSSYAHGTPDDFHGASGSGHHGQFFSSKHSMLFKKIQFVHV